MAKCGKVTNLKFKYFLIFYFTQNELMCSELRNLDRQIERKIKDRHVMNRKMKGKTERQAKRNME